MRESLGEVLTEQLKRIEKENLIRASLIAGLKLFGLPNVKKDIEDVEKYARRFSINLNDFEKVNGSGLLWSWWEGGEYLSEIVEQKISERLYEQAEAVRFEDLDECISNSMTDDFEYVFTPEGVGFTGYMDEKNEHLSREGIFDKHIRSADGKLYTFYVEVGIFIYEMDIDTYKEAEELVKKWIKEKRK